MNYQEDPIMSDPEFHVGDCPCCGIGQIAVMQMPNNGLICLCDECLTAWANPADTSSCDKAIADKELPTLSAASQEKIKEAGWWEMIRDPGWY
jgi:hypothetical protein